MNTLGNSSWVSLNANLLTALLADKRHKPFELSAVIWGGVKDLSSLVSTLKNLMLEPQAYKRTELFIKNAFWPL